MTYLVLARCDMDDIPLRFFSSPEEAETFAQNVTLEHVQEIAQSVLRLRAKNMICLSLVSFDENGMPLSSQCVKDVSVA